MMIQQALLLLVILDIYSVTGQHTVANVSTEKVYFSSPGFVDGLDYGNNMVRDFRFQTFYPGHRLKLEVVTFILEPAIKSCPYDKVEIYDGYDKSAALLAVLCGNITTGTTYLTANNTVYVYFESDGTNTFKGFEMTVVSDGPLPSTSSTAGTLPVTIPSTTAEYLLTDDAKSKVSLWLIIGCSIGSLALISILLVSILIRAKKKRKRKTSVTPVLIYRPEVIEKHYEAEQNSVKQLN